MAPFILNCLKYICRMELLFVCHKRATYCVFLLAIWRSFSRFRITEYEALRLISIVMPMQRRSPQGRALAAFIPTSKHHSFPKFVSNSPSTYPETHSRGVLLVERDSHKHSRIQVLWVFGYYEAHIKVL